MSDDMPAAAPGDAGELDARLASFRARRRGADGRESAKYGLFLTELARLLSLPRPNPAFALRAKDVRETTGPRYDYAMLLARSQADTSARAPQAKDGWPPLLLVVEAGRTIEAYSRVFRDFHRPLCAAAFSIPPAALATSSTSPFEHLRCRDEEEDREGR